MDWSWTEADWIRADAIKLQRFRGQFLSLLSRCFLVFSQDHELQIRTSDPSTVDDLISELEELAWFAWIFCGSPNLSVWFEDEELFDCPTQPQDPMQWQKLDSIQSTVDECCDEENCMSPATTLSKPIEKTSTQSAKIDRRRVQMRKLTTIAHFMGSTPENVERMADQFGFELSQDETGALIMSLNDAARLFSDFAVQSLSAISTEAAASNGAVTATEPAATATATKPKPQAKTAAKKSAPQKTKVSQPAEAATPETQPEDNAQGEATGGKRKQVTLGENFKVLVSDARRTAQNALAQFAKGQRRQRQIATAISNGTPDGKKYMNALLECYPDDKREEAAKQLPRQFKKLADSLSNQLQGTTAEIAS